MKNKILSIALVLGILLSIFSSIPVSATGEAYARSLPYAFYDYEDGVISLKGGTIVSGGMAGSSKCMKYVERSATYTDLDIVSGNSEEFLPGGAYAGSILKVSFYLKIAQKLTAGDLLLSVYGKNGTTVDSVPLSDTFNPENTTDWQKIEFSYTLVNDWPDKIALLLRFATHGASGDYVLGGEKTDPRTFYIDDMEVSVSSPDLNTGDSSESETDEPFIPENPALLEDKVDSLKHYVMTFEEEGVGEQRMSSIQRDINTAGQEWSGPGINTTETYHGMDGEYMSQLIDDPEDSYNSVMKLWLASTTSGDATTLKFSNTTARGQRNTPTASGTIYSGGKITYRFSYYLPQDMESNSPEFSVYHTTGGVTATIDSPLSTETGVWHTATLSYVNNGSTPLEVGGATLRTCGSDNTTNWTLKDHTGEGYGDREIYFDNFVAFISGGVIPEEPIVPETPLEDKVDSLDDYAMTFEEEGVGTQQMSSLQRDIDTAGQYNGPAINTTESYHGRAGIEMTGIIPDPLDSDSSNSVMKLWLASTTPGNATTLKFSNTTARGQANTPTASGTIPAGGKITYTFRYYLPQEVESNSPEFSVYHTTGDVTATIDSPLSTETGVWHTATLSYVNNGSTPLEVGDATFRTCNSDNTINWTVKNHTGEGYGDREIYFDNFRIYTSEAGSSEPLPEDEEKFPTSNELAVSGEFVAGGTVTFTHNFTASEEGAEDLSIVKFMCRTKAGEKASLGSCKMGGTFKVPTLPSDCTLSFEVVPVDGTKKLGAVVTYSYASIAGQDVTLNLSEFEADGSVKATVTIDNQRFDGSDIRAVLFVLMLDDEGGVIKYEQKAIVCANGTTLSGEEGTLVVDTDNADPALSKVTNAKAFLWDCENQQSPSFINSIMEELAADKSVTKHVAE